MGSITIRNIDDELKRGLRIRAARQGVSMEEEMRQILRAVVKSELSIDELEARQHRPDESAWDFVKGLREEFGTFELDLPSRTAMVGSTLPIDRD